MFATSDTRHYGILQHALHCGVNSLFTCENVVGAPLLCWPTSTNSKHVTPSSGLKSEWLPPLSMLPYNAASFLLCLGHLWYFSYQPQATWCWTGLLDTSSRIRSTWGGRVDELDCFPRARWKMGSSEEYPEPDPAGSVGCMAAGGSLWDRRSLVVKRWLCNVKDCVGAKNKTKKHPQWKKKKKIQTKEYSGQSEDTPRHATETGHRIKNDLEKKDFKLLVFDKLFYESFFELNKNNNSKKMFILNIYFVFYLFL